MIRLVPAMLLALLLVATPLAQRGGQAPSLPPRPTDLPPPAQFRSSVEIVHLDVSVLDRNRQPVRGLTPEDFTIAVDGTPQTVAVFSAVEIPEVVPPSAPWMRDVAPDVQSNDGLQERRLFLIIIDDAVVEASPFAMQNVKKAARGVIDRLGPSDLAAVVFTRDNRNSQDFTSDRARLLAAADKYTVGFRGMGGMDDLYLIYSANVLENAVEAFTTLADRRKSIVYIGQGIPADLASLASPATLGLPENGGQSAASLQGLWSRIKTGMERTFAKASRANVNVYPIDVCGLRVPNTPQCVPGLEQDYLRIVAANTGGRAVLDTNDFAPGIRAIFDENSAYYLLGFRPTDTRQDGKVRRLDVKVSRPGVEVRTRSGYESARPDAAKRAAVAAAQPLGVALSGVLPKSDLPLHVSAVPFAVPGKREAAVAIVVGIRQPIRTSEARVIEKVDLQIAAYNTEGKAFGATRFNANVTMRPGATGLAEYEVASRLDLRPGRYQLRIAANIGTLATSGSLYYDIDVPDFSVAGVTMTPLLLAAAPAPMTGRPRRPETGSSVSADRAAPLRVLRSRGGLHPRLPGRQDRARRDPGPRPGQGRGRSGRLSESTADPVRPLHAGSIRGRATGSAACAAGPGRVSAQRGGGCRRAAGAARSALQGHRELTLMCRD